MQKNQFKKALQKIKKRTIQSLLYISEDKYDLAMSPFFTCFKIVVFYLQLEGYIFSQYESKPLSLPENIYLSYYTQLSPPTFFLLEIGNDFLTQFFFFLIFALHITVYLLMIRMSLDSEIRKPNFMKKTLNLFFINFQWMFITPFQEISVGVMVCGKNAFIQENKDSPTCPADKNKIFYIFGILGTFLVTVSGFSISYFFRNYEFYDRTFSRQFSYSNLMRIIIHQLVIILYYINFNDINYVKHSLQQILGFTLIADILINQPFGYSFEANFYCAASFIHQYLLILTSIWIFSSIDDSFFFLTFILFIPLFIVLSNQFQKRDQIFIINSFKLNTFNDKADKYLEEIYRNAEESDTSQISKVIFIQIINHHVRSCDNPSCFCEQDAQSFLQNYVINFSHLNKWAVSVFEISLKLSLFKSDYTYYERIALKYVTFLAKYKNNPINAYQILQSIMNNQQTIKGRKVQRSSFYFFNIQEILQKRNRIIFRNRDTHQTQQTKLLLKGQSMVENIGKDIQFQIELLSLQKQKFWEDYYNNKLYNFQFLTEKLNKVERQVTCTRQLLNKLRTYKSYQKFECISILNLELLFTICVTNDIKEAYDIQKKIQSIFLNEQQEQEIFLNSFFFNSQSIGIVTNISQHQRGEIWKPNQSLLKGFFEMEGDILNINQVLPSFVFDIHDLIIENLINKGRSYKMEQQSLIFSKQGSDFIQPLLITLSFFFPKFEKDFQFYLIAFLKKVEDNYRIGDRLINNTGYIYFDAQFNILGISSVISEKIKKIIQTEINPTQIELCYLIPSLIECFIQQYKLMIAKDIIHFQENELIASRQQESFCIPEYFNGREFLIKPHHSIKKRLAELEDVFQDLQKADDLLHEYQVQFSLYSKPIPYSRQGTTNFRELFLIKLQFLDEDESEHDEYQEETQNIKNNDRKSQKSQSTNHTIMQQTKQFHYQLNNQQNTKLFLFYSIINLMYLGIYFGAFIYISLAVAAKYDMGSNCKIIQIQIISESAAFSALINAISNEKLGIVIDIPNFQIQVGDEIVQVSQKDYQQISSELIEYTISSFANVISQNVLSNEIEQEIQFQILNEVEKTIYSQNLTDVLILRQILLQSAQNYKNQRNFVEMTILIRNYPLYIKTLNGIVQNCLSDFNSILQLSINSSTQILIFVYGTLFLLFMTQMTLINRFIHKRKLILKLFTRVEYREAFNEAEKFKFIVNHLRNCDNIWLSKKIKNLVHDFDAKHSTKNIDKPDLSNPKIVIQHYLKIIGNFLMITLITLITFIYIISFHVTIVQSSNSLTDYFSFKQQLQSFQYEYYSQITNCLYQMLYRTYANNQQILQLIYQQENEKYEVLQQDLINLNTNSLSRLIISTNGTEIMNLLQFNEEQQQLFYSGDFCELNGDICEISGREIEFQNQLIPYYNKSIQQLLLVQGQIFSQNIHFFQLTNEINENLIKIIESQNYFLNNLWGFDLIIHRFSESLKFFIERIDQKLSNNGQQMLILSLIVGVLNFLLMLIVLILLSDEIRLQSLKVRNYLIHVPVQAIIKKNFIQQLKFID